MEAKDLERIRLKFPVLYYYTLILKEKNVRLSNGTLLYENPMAYLNNLIKMDKQLRENPIYLN